MTKLKLLVLFLFAIPLNISAQRYVSGIITETTTNKPIADATVFIANTTEGSTTKSDGSYQLKIPGNGNFLLSVSHAAYQPEVKTIEPGDSSCVINVALLEEKMRDSQVKTKVVFRNRDVALFWKTILGEEPLKKGIYAINPEVPFFYYNPETNILRVTCHTPLQIVNDETGYNIQYVLYSFTQDYNTNIVSWEGQCMFEEIETKNKRQALLWERKRENVYNISVTKFIRSLYNGTLLENGFLVTTVGVTEVVEKIPEIGSPEYIKRQKEDIGRNYEAYRRRPGTFTRSASAAGRTTLLDIDDFLKTDSINNCKILDIPFYSTNTTNSTIMLACFGEPMDSKKWKLLSFVQNFKENKSSSAYYNAISTAVAPLQIYSDGTFKNQLRLINLFDTEKITGINKMLPIEYGLEEKN